jgi:quinol monooxygenase YgiN
MRRLSLRHREAAPNHAPRSTSPGADGREATKPQRLEMPARPDSLAAGGVPMPTISRDPNLQTVFTTFEMTPGTCQDLLDLLRDAYETFIRHQSGFISAALHVNDAQTRIANYSQWKRREDFLAMLRSDEMRARNREINNLCRSFEPVMYEVADSYN